MARPAVPFEIAVRVFFRDRWLCSHCRRPTIFPPALKFLAARVADELPDVPLAYWDERWRRDRAPLLDELGASVDHVQAFALGGAHDESNFATICAKCNARKGTRSREQHAAIDTPRIVKGKYGEPTAWDGLASTFVVLARQRAQALTASEKSWLAALEAWFRAPAR